MRTLRVTGLVLVLAAFAAASMLPATSPPVPVTEIPPSDSMPMEYLYTMNTFFSDDACCSGGANGGADPTGNECTRLEDVDVEFANGRRVVNRALNHHQAQFTAAGLSPSNPP